MAEKTHVLVGLSGGVDSAVAACLLLEQGYAVTGVTMAVYDGPPGPSRGNACYDCAEAEDIAAAADLAAGLGIGHHVFDCSGQYRRSGLDYFRAAYLSGKTPNPCVRCNHMLKFGILPALAAARGLHWEYFATGHYAHVEYARRFGRHVLRRGVEPGRDQSYFLYRLSQEQLARALFPLGAMRKEEVRALAARRGIPVHDKPDSQDFYSGHYTELIGANDRPGNIVDETGKVLGRHPGFWRFTPGQRRGLGVAAAFPLYVLRVDAARNEVVVGPYARSLADGCLVGEQHFAVPLEALAATDRLRARIRSSQPPLEVAVRPEGDVLRVDFAEPGHGVAPGQSLVLYLDDMVIGGGIIQ
jgi:tRNA-specific 2-thiouridylase